MSMATGSMFMQWKKLHWLIWNDINMGSFHWNVIMKAIFRSRLDSDI